MRKIERPEPKKSGIKIVPREPLVEWISLYPMHSAGQIYDALARKGVVPNANPRGRPKIRSKETAIWAAIWRDYDGLSLLQIGAVLENWHPRHTAQDSEGVINKAVSEARRSGHADQIKLRKLAIRYVKEGRDLLARMRKPRSVSASTPRSQRVHLLRLRRHFVETIMWAVADWLAGEGRPFSKTNTRLYRLLLGGGGGPRNKPRLDLSDEGRRVSASVPRLVRSGGRLVLEVDRLHFSMSPDLDIFPLLWHEKGNIGRPPMLLQAHVRGGRFVVQRQRGPGSRMEQTDS